MEDTRKLVKSALVSMAHDSVLSSLGESERARLHAESVSSCESKQPINSVAIHAAGVLREIKIGIAYRSSDWIEWVGDAASSKVCIFLYDHRIWSKDGSEFSYDHFDVLDLTLADGTVQTVFK